MERYLCIHGHFYQPPRENPWLEAIEIQDSAYPYHDWNERVTAECYAPNSASRILDGERRILDIVNNYARISFNFGPTVLSWIDAHTPEIYQAILDADKQSIQWRSGHGNAIAQVYNHLIMPLANIRDRRTQVLWGIKDFERRFKRFPEGMWLSETAVDLETLNVLAECGIRFTILGQHQASRVRRIGTGKWKDVSGGRIDPARPYLCRLPSGRSINIFFYDGPISRAVAFEKLLNGGEDFANRLLTGFSDLRQWPQVFNIATDGESYGHHHEFGDMALAYALHHIESNNLATLTNYGEYLEKNPPLLEVQIFENTSWSCVHGIERWKSNCGCNSGGNSGWNQDWRAPLREALDWLRDQLSSLCEERTKEYLENPWTARDDYINMILDRSEEQIGAFLSKHAVKGLSEPRVSVLKVMEIQRHAMLMYTSCGWFFDELSGLETVQVIHYAGRAIQLAREIFGIDLESSFKDKLSMAKSNIAEHNDGAGIYQKFVKPSMVDFKRVAAHYAISSLIKDYGDTEKIYSYSIRKEDYQPKKAGAAKVAVGRAAITSDITCDGETVSFCALHLGGHVFNSGIKTFPGNEAHEIMKQEIITAVEREAIDDIAVLMERHFGMTTYSLMHLFREEQRKILSLVFGDIMEQFENAYRLLYEHSRIPMGFLSEAGIPVQEAFRTAAAFILNLDMKRAVSEDVQDADKIRGIISEINKWNLSLDSVGVEFMLRRKGEEMIDKLRESPSDISLLSGCYMLIDLLRTLPINVHFWHIQNSYYKIAEAVYREHFSREKAGDGEAAKWVEAFRSLGDKLYFNTSKVLPDN